MIMKNHTDLINNLAKRSKAKCYLEIGVCNPDYNFNKINIAKKVSVDPDPKAKAIHVMASDEYFAQFDEKFDIIFIDGLHEENQVRRDFENSIKRLKDKGFIVMHDCNPQSERITHYPRDTEEWCGNVYKFAMTLPSYSGINYRTVNFDYGCTVIWKDIRKTGKELTIDTSWETFAKYRKSLLRLVNREEFKETLDWKYWLKRRIKYFRTRLLGSLKN
jgi:Methyltransferase domain